MKVMWRRPAPWAGDEVDLVNHMPAGAHGGERRRSRVSRTPARALARGLAVSALTLLLALAIGPGVARAATYNTWSALTSAGTTTLYGVCFTDASNGWVVSTAGVVRHTTNGGTAWATQTLTPTTTQTLRSVSFVSSQVGWAVGGSGVIYHTTNGGTTWSSQTSGITGTIYGVDFTDANNGWYVAAGGVVRHTTNGGATWTAQTLTPTTTQNLRGVYFLDSTGRLGGRRRWRRVSHHQRRHHVGLANIGHHGDDLRGRLHRRQQRLVRGRRWRRPPHH